jgi:hypothetical protein
MERLFVFQTIRTPQQENISSLGDKYGASNSSTVYNTLPHSISPISNKVYWTTQTMPCLGIWYKDSKWIYIKTWPFKNTLLNTQTKLRMSQSLAPFTACDSGQPWLYRPTTNHLETEFLQTQSRQNLDVGPPLASRRHTPSGYSDRLPRGTHSFLPRQT